MKNKVIKVLKVTEMIAFLVAAVFVFIEGIRCFSNISVGLGGGFVFLLVTEGIIMLAEAAGLGFLSVKFLISIFGNKTFDAKYEYPLAAIVPLGSALMSFLSIIVLLSNKFTVGAMDWLNFFILGACGAVCLIAFFVKDKKLVYGSALAAVVAGMFICLAGGGDVVGLILAIAVNVGLLCFAEVAFLPILAGADNEI